MISKGWHSGLPMVPPMDQHQRQCHPFILISDSSRSLTWQLSYGSERSWCDWLSSLSQGNVITQPPLPRWIETGGFGTRERSRKMPRLRDDPTCLVWVNERGIMSFQRSQAIEPADSIPDSVHLLTLPCAPGMSAFLLFQNVSFTTI